eukprot:CAMPEP_0116822868 /NCGR_PEP_ID=MMETSP0418-20121206/513_1 /TAXON_ID=1158023 /ORGANISM="Astrosyne radiata, Strain 13vi08-1A" /LENGTH=318 /DNA_ID=CAMNT_0004451041 /DNA_START=180 /DNA_END=1136 /DNA_ORIENTATION=-
MDKLFQDQTDAAEAAANVAAASWDPTWYNVADQAVNAINFVHNSTGWSYGLSIVGVTCVIRVFMFPIFVRSQQNSSRMAHMQPEMQALRAKLESLGKNVDQETQIMYGLQMKALFEKYGCNPFRALLLPLFQMPVFTGMFFGLRKMPEYFGQELSNSGLFWFTDLTVPDPYYILSVGSAMTFLVTIELGKEQMMASNPRQGQMVVNIFRGMSLIMIPVISSFPACLNWYWLTNNCITMGQSMAFRNPTIRKQLGIWEPPKPVPGVKQADGIVESLQKAVSPQPSEADKITSHNEAVDAKKKMAAATKGRYRYKRSRKR